MRQYKYNKFYANNRFDTLYKKVWSYLDKDGDGKPDYWQSNKFSSWNWKKFDWSDIISNAPSVGTTPPAPVPTPSPAKLPTIQNLPVELNMNEDSTAFLDLSAARFRKFGKNKDVVTIELNASEGTFDAVAGNKLTITGIGTETLILTGQLRDIKRYLRNDEAISYSGAADDFGDTAATLTLTATTNGNTVTLGSVNVDIEDVPDDQMGTAAADTLIGDDGVNTLTGLGAGDYLSGLGGADSIIGGAGNDTILGGGGEDTLEGGDDADVLQYAGSTSGVTVDLNADASGQQQASGGDAEGDVISGFEHVYGSDAGDTIIGNDDKNILFGYAGDDNIQGNGGDDVIRGGEGADTMDGGDGVDWLRYQGSVDGVTVDLPEDGAGFQSASGGDAEGDVISGFENVQGSDAGDTITGNDDKNYIIGYAGDDNIAGSAGSDTIRGGEGADTLDGGADADLLQYNGSGAGITIDLRADGAGFQSASGGDAEGDVISGFEHVYATDHADSLTGSDDRNILYGYDGDDTIDGGDGKDALRGGNGADTFIFSTALGAGNVDRILDFSAAADSIQLAGSIFTGLIGGALDASAFLINDTGLADDAAQRIIYESDTGHLYFDSDGNGAAEGIVFATLTNLASIDETDFFVI